MSVYIGLDPGKAGAIVALDAGGKLLYFNRVPTLKDKKKSIDVVRMAGWITDLRACRDGADIRATIEKVHSMPGQGTASMFSFGRSFGLMEMFIAANDMPVQYATPQAWQRVMLAGLPRGKETKASAVLAATRLWPGLSDTLRIKAAQGVADAALIAEYGRRTWEVQR